MLMKAKFDCQCHGHGQLVNIIEWYEVFCDALSLQASSESMQLRQCSHCMQFWRVDAPGVFSVSYAVRLEADENWQAFDAAGLIKQRMLEVRGGHGDQPCRRGNCRSPVINGSAYCLDHLYRSGARQ